MPLLTHTTLPASPQSVQQLVETWSNPWCWVALISGIIAIVLIYTSSRADKKRK